jgi:hypothetical protein
MSETPLPRGEFEEKTPTEELAEAIIGLALWREQAETAKASAVAIEAEMLTSNAGLRLLAAKDLAEAMKVEVEEAEAAVRTLALDIHAETTERQPHGAVLVKQYTTFKVDDWDELFDHVRVHVPQCVKLNIPEVKKVAKVIPLPSVTLEPEYRATIKRDLSLWLPVISQDELDYRREAK